MILCGSIKGKRTDKKQRTSELCQLVLSHIRSRSRRTEHQNCYCEFNFIPEALKGDTECRVTVKGVMTEKIKDYGTINASFGLLKCQ